MNIKKQYRLYFFVHLLLVLAIMAGAVIIVVRYKDKLTPKAAQPAPVTDAKIGDFATPAPEATFSGTPTTSPR